MEYIFCVPWVALVQTDMAAIHSRVPVISGPIFPKILRLEITKMLYDIKEVGDRIRWLRKEQGMTQAQLAAKLNIGDRHLRKIEAGEKGPSIDILIEIATLLGVSLDYIIMGKQSQSDLKQRLCVLIQSLSALAEEL